MKKIFIFWIAAAMLVLTGCGKTADETQQDPGTASAEMVMDDVTELMAGTMLLETTHYPLNTEQSTNLLLLWKGYRAVTISSTSADTEIQALEEQIKGVFSEDQISAIDALQLSSETLTTKLSEAGIQMAQAPGGGAQGTETTDMMQMPEFGDGQMPAGDRQMPSGGGGQMPGGGGMMPSGGGMMADSFSSSITGETETSTLSSQATQQASMGLADRTVNTMVLNAVIRYLNEAVNK